MTDENKPPERPSFYAVIPAQVRYDKSLPPRAILLYGEISALCNCHGYCDARNAYFAKWFQVSKNTISDLIGQLEAAGYIRTEVLRNEKNAVDVRRIWINAQFAIGADVSASGAQTPIPKNRDTSPEKSGDPIPKNREENNTSINNKYPIAPKDVLETLSAYAGQDKALEKAIMDFAKNRHALRKTMSTVRTAELLTAKLDKFSGGDRRMKISMLEEATEKNWMSVVPPKGMTTAAATRVIETEEVPNLD